MTVTLVAPSVAQTGAEDIGARLMAQPEIRRALDGASEREPWVIEQQVALCQIPAPPFNEGVRAEAFRAALTQLGLEQVRIDAVGNVIAVRPGRQARPNLVLSAHLDTVFPEGTDVQVRREGTVLKGPGIGDDCRGLAVLLGVLRTLQDHDIATEGTVTFVGTVGEEGLGDLRGVKHLFMKEMPGEIDRFVSIDGTSHGIVTAGVGSHRYRVTFRGPGGHSYGAFGMANPIHAMGRAIATIADIQVAERPKTTFNVGRIGGGTSINAIAFESWMEVDLRSESPDALTALDAKVRAAIAAAVDAENNRWSKASQVTAETTMVGNRPAGRSPDTSPLVRAALSVSRALDLPTTRGASSTDANTPMSLGIPAITIGGGGRGRAAHSLEEEFDTTDSVNGTRHAVLLTLALTQP